MAIEALDNLKLATIYNLSGNIMQAMYHAGAFTHWLMQCTITKKF